MEPKYKIGDIVSLKSHPYLTDITNVVVSGDHIAITPLLVVTAAYKISHQIMGEEKKEDHIKYKCIWYSVKSSKFKEATILEEDLKVIQKNASNISHETLKRGDRLIMKSSPLELAKRKSSLTQNEDSGDSGATTISALLSHVSPVLQVIELEASSKSNALISSAWNVKCLYFDTIGDKFSECVLPLDSLAILPNIDNTITEIQKSISTGKYLLYSIDKIKTIVRPKYITCRSGSYYLKAYDYILNRSIELEIGNATMSEINKPFEVNLPSFDIEKKPEAATKEFITEEIRQAIETAKGKNAFIRIRYKNQNDQLTTRTVTKFKLVTVTEGANSVTYLLGYCWLRKAERAFRVDRIQDFQELTLSFA